MPFIIEHLWWLLLNLRFDGIKEWKEESWADTEQNFKDTKGDIKNSKYIKIKNPYFRAQKKKKKKKKTITM